MSPHRGEPPDPVRGSPEDNTHPGCHDGRMRRLLIVDYHAGFRRAAREALEDEGYAVVGEAGTGAEALASVDRLRPDVILLDVQLPDMTGFQVADRLAPPRPR